MRPEEKASQARLALLLAAATGLLTGLGVTLFDWVTRDGVFGLLHRQAHWLQVFGPVAGLALAALALRWLADGASPATADEYIANFHQPNRSLDERPVLGRLVASIATLGLGGAMGYEGPSIYLGATVLLPKDYDLHRDQRYPVLYLQGHFGLGAPFGFTDRAPTGGRGQAGFDFAKEWMSADFPRMIAVTFQHPTPYFDDSYAVNSANNGPYGDALLKELVPYLEDHFRMSREPRQRVLTGGSTGGWESLALQLYHPEFFGGAWVFYPDPIDFRRWEMIDIYSDPSAFEVPGFQYVARERPMMRTPEGQTIQTVRMKSLFEATLGSHGRSCEQYDAWEAVYGPVGEDGYPKPLWNKLTGKIDHEVANYMRDHGFDLNQYAQRNWSKLGPQVKGKLHLYVGDMDNYALNLAVYLFEDFMKTTDAGATFEYGRPMKGHGWHPMNDAALVRMMAAAVGPAF